MKFKELATDKSRRKKSDSVIMETKKPTTRKRGLTPEEKNDSNASDSKKHKVF